MNEQNILNSKQVVTLIILFLFGSSIVVGININAEVEQDSWISLIFSFVLNIPLILIFAKLVKSFPQKNIYDIFDILFGKKIGKIFSFLFVIHAIYLCSILLRNFAEYIEITTLSETPKIPIMIFLILIAIYLCKSRMNTLGRWAHLVLLILIITIVFTIVLALPVIKTENILPIWGHPSKSIITCAFRVFMLPFSELIIILGLIDVFRVEKKEKKVFLLGVSITGVILLIILIRNIMVLGAPMLRNSFFASYETARILQLGDFLTRIEGAITINFILAGMTKGTIFIISIAKGIAHLTKNNNYKNLVTPSSLLVLAICPFLFEDVIDMFSFSEIFGIYAIPLQVILPITLWILTELYLRKKRQKKAL